MAVLVVGGGNRGAGKTALVGGIIAALHEQRWIAVKITSEDHGKPTPVWEETEAGQGTDTARFMAAGAARAFLVSASDSEMKERIEELERALGPEQNVIYESNRVIEVVEPDLCLIVDGVRNEADAKPSFRQISALADAVVSHDSADSVSEEFVGNGSGGGRPWFQLAAFEHISPELIEWVRRGIFGLHASERRCSDRHNSELQNPA